MHVKRENLFNCMNSGQEDEGKGNQPTETKTQGKGKEVEEVVTPRPRKVNFPLHGTEGAPIRCVGHLFWFHTSKEGCSSRILVCPFTWGNRGDCCVCWTVLLVLQLSEGIGGGPYTTSTVAMKILAWNCRGLKMSDNPTVPYLSWLVHSNKANIMFLSESECSESEAALKTKALNFKFVDGVDSVGFSGGLLLCWGMDVFIDIIVKSPFFLICKVAMTGLDFAILVLLFSCMVLLLYQISPKFGMTFFHM